MEGYIIKKTNAHTMYVLNNDVMTVGDLKKMLANVPDDFPIITGRNLDDCDEYFSSIVIGSATVGMFTEGECE